MLTRNEEGKQKKKKNIGRRGEGRGVRFKGRRKEKKLW